MVIFLHSVSDHAYNVFITYKTEDSLVIYTLTFGIKGRREIYASVVVTLMF